MKIYYIYHSGFAVETENYKLIFDYYMEPKKNSDNFKVEDFIIDNKQVIVFSSHSHGDHFKEEILTWKEKNPKIKYVLSDDIKVKEEAIFVKEGDSLEVEGAKIKVFGSTDLGVSYFVECDGQTLFHAGDLNWWYWSDDTKDEEEYMRNLYYSKMELIEKTLKDEEIDYLFYPIDPRLEEFSMLGIKYFLEKVRVKNIVPMHLWDRYETIDKIAEIFYDKKVIRIKKNGALLEL